MNINVTIEYLSTQRSDVIALSFRPGKKTTSATLLVFEIRY